ncbi:putative expressed protein [Lyophyllum shimeji]|uniref:Expressed protein n=1 Tax=Lyophyllum shimeji TaxID=47721 RepID=A0A9P3UHP3_LYOSH|nr:putative expressed protein [Lyophyllum shimeji]
MSPASVIASGSGSSKNADDANCSGYAFPTTFRIGRTRTDAPLVNTAQVKGHLALLHAFIQLRARTDALREDSKDAVKFMPADQDKRWVWFVGFAAERFTVWCESLHPDDFANAAKTSLPPLDVLMVWHAYMLNPGWYAEDSTRLPMMRNVAAAGRVFSSALASGLQDILTSEPDSERVSFWESKTNRPFDPLEDARKHPSKNIQCPYCRKVVEIPYLNAQGHGYLQGDFHLICTPGNYCCRPSYTLRRWTEIIPGRYSSNARSEFKRPREGGEEAWIVSILDKMVKARDVVRFVMPPYMRENPENVIGRIHSAYEDGRPFSVDLIGAVVRQGSFVKKMRSLGWIEPTFFNAEVGEVALQHAVARYHAFLDLMAASPDAFYVPTLDIDLVWHTHQLAGERYNEDCMTYVGHYVDHDDKVVEHKLSAAFDITSRDWSTRFGLPYTHCGCPPPGKTLRQRLSRLLRLPALISGPPAHLVPPSPSTSQSRSQTGRQQDGTRAATHPSEHNSVLYLRSRKRDLLFASDRGHPTEQRKWKEKLRKRRLRQSSSSSSGFLSFFRNRAANAPCTHAPEPFLVPMENAYYQEMTCAAHDGRYVRGPGEGSAGMSACAVGGTLPKEVVKPVPRPTKKATGQGKGKGTNAYVGHSYGGYAASVSGGAALSGLSIAMSSCGAGSAGSFSGGFSCGGGSW